MKKLFIIVFLVTVTLLVACGGTPSAPAAPTTYTVTMGAVAFNTASITIPKGSIISFTTEQGSTAHNLVNGTSGQPHPEQGVPDFGTGGQTVGPGKTWTSAPWNITGIFHITCTYHPTTMTMTVVVTG